MQAEMWKPWMMDLTTLIIDCKRSIILKLTDYIHHQNVACLWVEVHLEKKPARILCLQVRV